MRSVTGRIKEIKQPEGGYLNPKFFDVVELTDNNELYEEENISPVLVGMAVDYMTRYVCTGNLRSAFKISLKGAEIINESHKACKLLNGISGLDDTSIINACKLCGYDVCYRAGTRHFQNVDWIFPDENTISNIRIMVRRGMAFFEKYGPIVKDGITFAGGYTHIISAGDADFITKDTLWDFKCSKDKLKKEHTLQLVIYYLLGLRSYECDFSNITKIGIFNPRKNIVYQYEIKNISKEIRKEIETEVIGYGDLNQSNHDSDIMTLIDVSQYLGISKYMVMKYYSEYGLPLRKENNKYIINKYELLNWIEYCKVIRERQIRQVRIRLAIISIVSVILILIVWILSLFKN